MKFVHIEPLSSQFPPITPIVCSAEEKAIDFIRSNLNNLGIDYAEIDWDDDWFSDLDDLLFSHGYILRYIQGVKIID